MAFAAKYTEKQFTADLLKLARLCGWRTAHFRPARTATGWRTAVQGDGKGFPDLVLTHWLREKLLFVELKTDEGKSTPAQEEWRLHLVVAGANCRVWRPRDWLEIERILKGEGQP